MTGEAATADVKEPIPGTLWISIPVSTALVGGLDRDQLKEELGGLAADAALAAVGGVERNG